MQAKRSEHIMRIVCLALAAFLVYQFARLVLQRNPLAQLNIPPAIAASLASNAVAAAKATNTVSRSDPAKQATNSPGVAKATNSPAAATGTNSPTAGSATNLPTATRATNFLAGSNRLASSSIPGRAMNPMGMPMMPGGRPGPGMAGPPLPPQVQARLDRITQSEILGPVVRPLPMGLLGIGGRHAFLRAPNGQTGLIREGEELGGVKLLQIGTNRVLIEHEGQKKELNVFSGFGSESLLPQGKQNQP